MMTRLQGHPLCNLAVVTGFAVGERCQRLLSRMMFEGADCVVGSDFDDVNRGRGWHGDLGGEPAECITDACAAGLPDTDRMALAGVKDRFNVFFMWTRTRMTGGAIGILLKSQRPWT